MPSGVSDKGAHLLLYSGLGTLLVRARAGGWRRPVTLGIAAAAIVVATLYGISDEIHQHFVPLRQVEVRDILADAIGASLARARCTRGPGSATRSDCVRPPPKTSRTRPRTAEAKRRRGV